MISGSIALTKFGAGIQILSGANTYSGATTITAGTLRLAALNVLPSGAGKGNVTIVPGAVINGLTVPGTLDIGGWDQNINGLNATATVGQLGATVINTSPLSFQGGVWGWLNNGVFTTSVGIPITGTDNTTTTTNALTVGNDNAAGNFYGSLQDGFTVFPDANTAVKGILALTKIGLGNQLLGGVNTYSGATLVSGGSLELASNFALGSTVAATTVVSGASVILDNGITITGETITISGNSTNSAGALQANAAATATWAGPVNLGVGASVGAQAGGTLNLTGPIGNGAGTSLDVSGLGGTGTVVVSNTGGTNTYTGATNIIRGTLKMGATNALPVGTVLNVDSSNAAENAIFDMNGFNQAVGALQSSGAGSGAGGSIITNSALSGTNLLTVNGATSTTFSGSIQDGATASITLTKTGVGTLTLDGTVANTYTGLTTVSGGTLLLNKTPGVNAIGGDAASSKVIADILVNGGTLQWGANHQVGNTVYINLTSGTVNVNGKTDTIFEFSNSGGTYLSGRGGGLTVIDPTWSGGLNDVFGDDVYGNLLISGGTNTIHGDETTAMGAGSVTIGVGGLEFAGTSSPTLIISSDHGIPGPENAGGLILNGDVSFTGASGTASITSGPALLADGITLDGTQPGAFIGTVDLGAATRTFTIANGTAATDMFISARILGTGGLTKEGAGLLELAAPNTYTGATTVNDGTLRVTAAGSLNTGNNLTVNNSGIATFGNVQALGTVAVNNSGTVNFNAATSSVAVLSGPSATATMNLGSGTVLTVSSGAFAGSITGATGNLVKDTGGTLLLTGSNTFAGTTTVNGGTLTAGANGTTDALGATTDVTVNSGGTLLLNGTSGTIGSQALNTQVNDSATVTVNGGGKLAMEGVNYARENLGALTLTGNSIIDFGTLTGNTARFTSLTFGFGFSSLSIYNWTGSLYGVGTSTDIGTSDQDRLAFTNKPDLGPNNNWANISFYSDNGMNFLGNAQQISFEGGFELVPVPEPTTLLGGLMLVGLIGYRERRRLGSLVQGFMKRQAV